MLPIITISAPDENCIYSTLLFIINQAQPLHIDTSYVTFDQVLWIKVHEIVATMKLNIVVRLGEFHTMLRFLGRISYLMEDQVWRDCLRQCMQRTQCLILCLVKQYLEL